MNLQNLLKCRDDNMLHILFVNFCSFVLEKDQTLTHRGYKYKVVHHQIMGGHFLFNFTLLQSSISINFKSLLNEFENYNVKILLNNSLFHYMLVFPIK